MIGTSEIYKILSASSTVLALLTRKGTSPNYVYNIEVAMVEPNDWGINDSSIIIYQVGPDSLAEVYDVNHTVNCRANTEAKAKALARAVAAALHRVTFSQMMFYCTLEQPIAPADDTDNFNAPVTVRVMGSK